ncbi:MAG: hypothetical protein IPL61_16590 [Myxococcales bacterium]|nr:hypothetical protein [Myxococcales bacterium]
MSRAGLALLGLTACGAGVGPYQPRRDAWATAGGARPDLSFDEQDRRVAHQAAKRLTLPELGGGTAPMYAFAGGVYLGVKQGASQTRVNDGPWSSTVYAFEGHAGVTQAVLDDRVVLGGNLFAVGYGSGDDAAMARARYLAAGVELSGALGLTPSLAVRAAAGRLYGQARITDAGAEDRAAAGGWRGTAGVDWAWTRVHGNDLIVTAELQGARVDELTLLGAARQLTARALMLELVLVGS